MAEPASVQLKFDKKQIVFDEPLSGEVVVKANTTIDVLELSLNLISEGWKYDSRPNSRHNYRYRRSFDKKYRLAGEKNITKGKTVRYKFKLAPLKELISKEVPDFLKPMMNLVNKDFINKLSPYTNPAEDPNWYLVARLVLKPDIELLEKANLSIVLR